MRKRADTNQPAGLDTIAAAATWKDARRIVDRIANMDMNEADRGDIIALAACLTFSKERESMLEEIKQAMMPYIAEAYAATERLAAERIRAREGGAG